jgi:hypothetical protein
VTLALWVRFQSEIKLFLPFEGREKVAQISAIDLKVARISVIHLFSEITSHLHLIIIKFPLNLK